MSEQKTPRTDALHERAVNNTTGYYIAEKAKRINDDLWELSRTLERSNAELLEALEMLNNEFKRLPQSLGYKYTHTGKVDLIIARAKGEA